MAHAWSPCGLSLAYQFLLMSLCHPWQLYRLIITLVPSLGKRHTVGCLHKQAIELDHIQICMYNAAQKYVSLVCRCADQIL